MNDDVVVEIAANAMAAFVGRYGLGNVDWWQIARAGLAAVDVVNPPPRYEQRGWVPIHASRYRNFVVHELKEADDDVPVFVPVSDDIPNEEDE